MIIIKDDGQRPTNFSRDVRNIELADVKIFDSFISSKGNNIVLLSHPRHDNHIMINQYQIKDIASLWPEIISIVGNKVEVKEPKILMGFYKENGVFKRK